MELQHTNYHQAYYVNGLIAPEDTYFKAPSTHDQISLQAALKFNGGGKPPPPLPLLLSVYIFAFSSSSQQATSTTHYFGRASHLLRKAVGN